jgi:phosphoglycolate phosphatase
VSRFGVPSEAPGAVVFDLDGVIVDSAPVIAECLAGALAEHGLPVPHPSAVRRLIGPPIQVVVRALTGSDDDELVDACVAGYRRRLVEATPRQRVFDGMAALLSTCRRPLAIATSKPVEIAEPTLEALGLRHCFVAVEGSRLGERGVGKIEVVGRAIAALAVKPIAMVGDRAQDIHAAHAHDLAAIGVAWGYGGERELRDAGAHVIARSPQHLRALLA